ncbi:uncharacterized protein LOC133830707 isoform X2 [Humulus lupulus]|uniref:uncharacterized protein LOC133830707 isoform X2 n=1 Tax=Humulus lupulus TaxID=3486 RepID=UPI002B417AB5|nr:uncharacterized protein LOC133830707 isoform X2 [Humulus lupulus]
MNKVRTGERVANNEILGFAKLFSDELTLDNISRLNFFMSISYLGSCLLFYRIKEDDKMIQVEGVESLLEKELISACRERVILGTHSVEEMREESFIDLQFPNG